MSKIANGKSQMANQESRIKNQRESEKARKQITQFPNYSTTQHSRFTSHASRIKRHVSRFTHPLFVLCFTFTLLVMMHGFTTPIFEAPDEVWHYAYVRWLAKGNGLPAMDNDDSGANQEVAQPPLYYAIAAAFSLPFPDDNLDALIWGNPGFGYQAPGTLPENKNMLIHTPQERFPWRGAALTIHATRFTSLFFGLVTIIAAWGLGYETFGTRRGALVTAMLVAFHPQFVFMCSVVSNDSAAAALSTATLWSIAYIVHKGLTTRRALVAGILVGLAALTKTSTILLFPLSGVTLLWSVLKDDVTKPKKLLTRLTDLQTSILPLASFILAVLLVGGWWYTRNTILYGDPLGMSSHLDTLWGRPEPATLIDLLPELPLLLRSFWAAYGWGHITWPEWVYAILWIGSGYFIVKSIRSILSHFTNIDKAAINTLTIFAVAGLWFAGIFAALIQWMRQVEAPHGRLLFPALGAWTLVIANGMVTSQTSKVESQKSQVGHWIDILFLVSTFTITALAPGARILATFAPPRLRAPEKVMRTVTATNLTFADQAKLLGISVDKERALPGDTFTVKACWEALQPMAEDYTVFIHLIGPENTRVAERHTYPGLGRFPTSLWPAGRAFCDEYRVAIETWAVGSIRYKLEVGLFNAETNVRLSAFDGAGNPLEPPVVGNLIVEYLPLTEFEIQNHIEATVGEIISLFAFDKPRAAKPGATLNVSLYWKALAIPNEDLIAFVHLWRPGDPQPIAQHDSSPREGWYPTSIWQPGDTIPDEHKLFIPDDLPPGKYPLWAGLYRSTDGTRLQATGPDGQYLHNLIPLGEITIQESQNQIRKMHNKLNVVE
jgi:4-amino-4-deoxy-L-arabinose transferase-like glycosyltransferase